MANQQEQQVMAAFIQWLPQNITKFQGQIPDEIIAPIANAKDENEVVNVLNQLSQSEEGNQLVAGMFQAFQEEASGQTGLFKRGGKLAYGLKKFQMGGITTGKVKVENVMPKTITVPIVERNAPAAARKNQVRVPNVGEVTNRYIGGAVGTNGRQVLTADEVVNGNTALTTITVPTPGDTLVNQAIAVRNGWKEKSYPKGSDEYRSVLNRLGSKGTPMWTALDRISKMVNPR